MRLRLGLAVLGLGVGVAGCGLVSGLGDLDVCTSGCDAIDGGGDGGNNLDAGPILDGATDQAVDAEKDTGVVIADSGPPPACSTPPGVCVQGIPQGWTLVSSGASCPASFTAKTYVANPTSGNGTCGCQSCSLTTSPTCGAVPWQTGSTSQCGGSSGSAQTGVCLNVSGSYVQLDPPNAQGGTCSVTASGAPSVITTNVVACTPPTACEEELCTGALGLPICIVQPGHVPCPFFFPKVQRVGSSASGSCNCSCNVSGICSANVSTYSGAACSGGASMLSVNGNCSNQLLGPSMRVNSTLLIKSTCNNGSPSASAALVNEQTICCK